MPVRRRSGQSFEQCRDFHYLGPPRRVSVWDETRESGEAITLSSDELGSRPGALWNVNSAIADTVQEQHTDVSGWSLGSVQQILVLNEAAFVGAIAGLKEDDQKRRPEQLRALSGQMVRVVDGKGKQRIALDIRDALPGDIVPLLVLDASRLVRQTYSHWEKQWEGWSDCGQPRRVASVKLV